MAIHKYTVYKIMKMSGAKKVSYDAAELLAKYLERVAIDITRHAMKIAEQSGRVTVKERDVRLVLEIRGEKV
jgi:histone H3/H4